MLKEARLQILPQILHLNVFLILILTFLLNRRWFVGVLRDALQPEVDHSGGGASR